MNGRGLQVVVVALLLARTALAVDDAAQAATGIDFYVLYDLSESTMTNHSPHSPSTVWSVDLMKHLVEQCADGDRITILGFAGQPAHLTTQLPCDGRHKYQLSSHLSELEGIITGRSTGSVPEILHRFGESIPDQEFNPIDALLRSRSKTSFAGVLTYARDVIRADLLNDAAQHAADNLEHRNVLMLLVSDGLPDEYGKQGAVPNSRDIDEWRKDIRRNDWIGRAFDNTNSIIVGNTALPAQDGGAQPIFNLRVGLNTSLWLGSRFACGEPQFSSIEEAQRQLWNINGDTSCGGGSISCKALFCASDQTAFGAAKERLTQYVSLQRKVRAQLSPKVMNVVRHGEKIEAALRLQSTYLSPVPLEVQDIEVKPDTVRVDSVTDTQPWRSPRAVLVLLSLSRADNWPQEVKLTSRNGRLRLSPKVVLVPPSDESLRLDGDRKRLLMMLDDKRTVPLRFHTHRPLPITVRIEGKSNKESISVHLPDGADEIRMESARAQPDASDRVPMGSLAHGGDASDFTVPVEVTARDAGTLKVIVKFWRLETDDAPEISGPVDEEQVTFEIKRPNGRVLWATAACSVLVLGFLIVLCWYGDREDGRWLRRCRISLVVVAIVSLCIGYEFPESSIESSVFFGFIPINSRLPFTFPIVAALLSSSGASRRSMVFALKLLKTLGHFHSGHVHP